MTKARRRDRGVSERLSKAGESEATAHSKVSPDRERVRSGDGRAATTADHPPNDDVEVATADRPSDDKVEAATGKRWEAWFSLLDQSGARERKHGETAALLMDEHGVPGWWAQSITIGYERARGMRLKHQQADGFTVSASKTIAVPLEVLFDAFVNGRTRRKWLPDGKMSLRTSRPGRTARFDWEDGPTRVSVSFVEKGPAKVMVTVAHERLADPGAAETAKTSWRERLANLKSFLEA